MIVIPFEMLNVALVQKLAALRYETWYVRKPPLAGTRPCTLTVGSPAPGHEAEPAEAVSVRKGIVQPLAQRRPSPNGADGLNHVSWKNVHTEVAGMPEQCSTTVSFPVAGRPLTLSSAPSGFTEFAQPWPLAPRLMHGH